MRVPGVPWWRSGVVYQIYPRSFLDTDGDGVGDLEGIRRRLDHLAWLGVDAIWLSPIFRSPMADFGYDVADYCDVDPLFGTLADFDRLLAEAHARGLRVLLDWVPNHTSDRHPWFVESRASRPSPKRDWYVWRDPAPERRAAQQLDGGVPARHAGVDARSGDRPVLPALLPPRAARPRLAQSRGRRGDARRRCASGSTAASTASASTSCTCLGKDPALPDDPPASPGCRTPS